MWSCSWRKESAWQPSGRWIRGGTENGIRGLGVGGTRNSWARGTTNRASSWRRRRPRWSRGRGGEDGQTQPMANWGTGTGGDEPPGVPAGLAAPVHRLTARDPDPPPTFLQSLTDQLLRWPIFAPLIFSSFRIPSLWTPSPPAVLCIAQIKLPLFLKKKEYGWIICQPPTKL